MKLDELSRAKVIRGFEHSPEDLASGDALIIGGLYLPDCGNSGTSVAYVVEAIAHVVSVLWLVTTSQCVAFHDKEVGQCCDANINFYPAPRAVRPSIVIEKLCISSSYELIVSSNLESARSVTSLWAQTYPRDDDPQTNLWLIYLYFGGLPSS
jgi:hypothetical protein